MEIVRCSFCGSKTSMRIVPCSFCGGGHCGDLVRCEACLHLFQHLVRCEAVIAEMVNEIAPRILRIVAVDAMLHLRQAADKLVFLMRQHIAEVERNIKHYDELFLIAPAHCHADLGTSIALKRERAAALTVLQSDWSGILFEKRRLEQHLGDEEAHALMTGSKKRRRSPAAAPTIIELNVDESMDESTVVD